MYDYTHCTWISLLSDKTISSCSTHTCTGNSFCSCSARNSGKVPVVVVALHTPPGSSVGWGWMPMVRLDNYCFGPPEIGVEKGLLTLFLCSSDLHFLGLSHSRLYRWWLLILGLSCDLLHHPLLDSGPFCWSCVPLTLLPLPVWYCFLGVCVSSSSFLSSDVFFLSVSSLFPLLISSPLISSSSSSHLLSLSPISSSPISSSSANLQTPLLFINAHFYFDAQRTRATFPKYLIICWYWSF